MDGYNLSCFNLGGHVTGVASTGGERWVDSESVGCSLLKGEEVRCGVVSPVNDSQGSCMALSIHHSLRCAGRVTYSGPSQLNDVT